MIALPAARRTGFTAATAAVLVAAVVLVLAGGGPPSHRHGAPGAAVYDEHCVLASFDSLHVDTVLPAGMPSTRPAELPSTASPPPAEAGPARVPAAGSRSPPTS